jgi:RNA polymerase sigma-70 factor, ECF subfamily
MAVSDRDWTAVLSRVIEGDRLALALVGRLVNGFLVRWNAYDFRDEWEDVVQEVITAAALAVRAGRVRDPQAIVAFVKATARFKYLDRLRILLGQRKDAQLAWEALITGGENPRGVQLEAEAHEDLRRALARIPDKKRDLVLAVYGAGQTYEEAAQASGVPLGTLKRYLRDGLAQLREALTESRDEE